VTVFENCRVEIGIQVVFNSAGHRLIAHFLRLDWACCCVGRHGSPAHRSLSIYTPATPTTADCALCPTTTIKVSHIQQSIWAGRSGRSSKRERSGERAKSAA